MPTYDYVCDACGHALELFQSMKEAPKRKCPVCGKLKLRRLIGAGGGLIFKGSGFYLTDYRSDSYKKAAEAEKKGSEASAETSGGAKDGPAQGGPAQGGPDKGGPDKGGQDKGSGEKGGGGSPPSKDASGAKGASKRSEGKKAS